MPQYVELENVVFVKLVISHLPLILMYNVSEANEDETDIKNAIDRIHFKEF